MQRTHWNEIKDESAFLQLRCLKGQVNWDPHWRAMGSRRLSCHQGFANKNRAIEAAAQIDRQVRDLRSTMK
jgi:hypothetical protein